MNIQYRVYKNEKKFGYRDLNNVKAELLENYW